MSFSIPCSRIPSAWLDSESQALRGESMDLSNIVKQDSSKRLAVIHTL